MLAKVIRVMRRTVGLPEEAVKSGEIKGDALYRWIRDIAAREDIQTMLEIGSSTGDGSTRAFVEGMEANKRICRLFCTELMADRFDTLQRRYADNPAVKCYRVSTVPKSKHATPEEVRAFYAVTKMPRADLPTILAWLDHELKQMNEPGIPEDGIEHIKRENKIQTFDMVLIDGSEFTGRAELDEVYGARYILLDDINVLKNHYNCHRLVADPRYKLIGSDMGLRNGFAVFERRWDPQTSATADR
jgi:hypothetical protein